MSHSRQAPAAHTTGSALPHHRFNGGRLAVYKKRPLSAVLHHLVKPLRPCAPRGSSYTSCGCGRGESDAHTHSWCTGDERGTVRCLARPESSLPRHKAKGPQQPLMPAEGGDRCPHEPRRRGLDRCGHRAREGSQRPAVAAVAAVGSPHVQRAAFKAQGSGFSQMQACRVRGHQSLAAGMWGCRWAQSGRRRPAVSGGEALCEEHGAAGRRQAV